MHERYWSNSKFADFVRGTPKPSHETFEGWDAWRAVASKKRIRYWLAENCIDFIQDAVTWPARVYYEANCYVRNRWISRTNALTANPRDIQPGSWCEYGDRILPCLFNELQNYVEVDLAWMNLILDDTRPTPRRFRFSQWRSKADGLARLQWEMGLLHDEECAKSEPYYMQPTSQAVVAKEVYELYLWWTEIYPQRRDPLESYSRDMPEDKKRELFNEANRIEEQCHAEDESMLIRLIKIRRSLWT